MGAYDQILANLTAWAEESSQVRAAFIIGSQARLEQPADAYSDLDVILVVEDPQALLCSDGWLTRIGRPRISFVEDTISGAKERRVLFEGALDVDFVLQPDQNREQVLSNPMTAALLQRGHRMLADKIGIGPDLARIAADSIALTAPPTETEFSNLVQDFWYHTVWSAKKWLRGELWAAKSCVDGYMKNRLLSMIQWHARCMKGWDLDTWHSGRFLETWAAKEVLETLPSLFAHYEREDVARALLSMMDLFRALAAQVAAALRFPYPAGADDCATSWVREHIEYGER